MRFDHSLIIIQKSQDEKRQRKTKYKALSFPISIGSMKRDKA